MERRLLLHHLVLQLRLEADLALALLDLVWLGLANRHLLLPGEEAVATVAAAEAEDQVVNLLLPVPQVSAHLQEHI